MEKEFNDDKLLAEEKKLLKKLLEEDHEELDDELIEKVIAFGCHPSAPRRTFGA